MEDRHHKGEMPTPGSLSHGWKGRDLYPGPQSPSLASSHGPCLSRLPVEFEKHLTNPVLLKSQRVDASPGDVSAAGPSTTLRVARTQMRHFFFVACSEECFRQITVAKSHSVVVLFKL